MKPNLCFWLGICLCLSTCLYAAESGPAQRFNSPNDAIDTLVKAAQANDTNALRRVFGASAQDLISPDLVQATEEREAFLARIKEKVEQVHEPDSRISLRIGADGWPFPIPLVQQNGQWFFDTDAGKEEVLNRRIGRDEINAIQVCEAYVRAQREYFSEDRNRDDVLEYAMRLRSSPGTRDGLYWPAESGEELSPFGPLIGDARSHGYRREHKIMSDSPSPYRGYYFKILTRQGSHAAGGKYNYVINGHMIAGFALVAWPAQWGNSGIMTFIVNQQGVVYQRDLGPKTSELASKLNTFDPDPAWVVVSE